MTNTTSHLKKLDGVVPERPINAIPTPPRSGVYNLERELTTFIYQQLHPDSSCQASRVDPIGASFSNVRQFYKTAGILRFIEDQNPMDLRKLMDIPENELDSDSESSDIIMEHSYRRLGTYIREYFLDVNKAITPSGFLLLHMLGDHGSEEERKRSLEAFRPLLRDSSIIAYSRLYTSMTICLLNIMMETTLNVDIDAFQLKISNGLRNAVSNCI